jgi:hypothetical protein
MLGRSCTDLALWTLGDFANSHVVGEAFGFDLKTSAAEDAAFVFFAEAALVAIDGFGANASNHVVHFKVPLHFSR